VRRQAPLKTGPSCRRRRRALPGAYRLPNLANLIEFQVFIGGRGRRG
jgi:hypothetical protein